MAVIIVAVVLSSLLILILIDAGMPEYQIRWFPGQKQWITTVYDHWARPLLVKYDWETSHTIIVGPEVWASDYYSPSPGHWVVEGCPISYHFIDSQGRNRYIFRTSEGLVHYYWDDIYAPKKPKKDSEENELFF